MFHLSLFDERYSLSSTSFHQVDDFSGKNAVFAIHSLLTPNLLTMNSLKFRQIRVMGLLAFLPVLGCGSENILIDPDPAVDAAAVQVVSTEDGIEHRDVMLNQLIAESPGKTVIVDFWASWCPPCKMLSPELDRVAERHQDTVVILKVDIDSEQMLAAYYQVNAIPDMRVFRNGKAVAQLAGFHTADEIFAKLP